MFCPQCGTQVPDNSKFCFNCGAALASAYTEPQNKKSIESQSKIAKSFTCCGRTINFTEAIVEYNNIRHIFHKRAQESAQKINSLYKNIKSFDEIFSNVLPEAMVEIREAVQTGVSTLMDHGIDYIDKEQLLDISYEAINPESFLNYFAAKAQEIDDTVSELEKYRGITRANRSRWQGGGFGVKGAIKGAITAGAMNLGMGAFRGIGDSITNAVDRSKIQKMKQAVIDDPESEKCLYSGVYNGILAIFETVYKILEDKLKVKAIHIDKGAAEAKVNNYYRLLREHSKSTEQTSQALDVMCACLQESPYSLNIYVKLFFCTRHEKFLQNKSKSEILDERNNILEIAKYFDIDTPFSSEIEEFYQEWLVRFKKFAEQTDISTSEKIRQLTLFQEEYPNDTISDLIKKLREDEKLNELQKSTSFQTKDLENAVKSGNLKIVWEAVDSGNAYAEYLLAEKCVREYREYNDSKRKTPFDSTTHTAEIEKIVKQNSIITSPYTEKFSKYLYWYTLDTCYGEHYRESTPAQRAEPVKKICELASQNVTSAIALKGFWGAQEYYNVTKTDQEGVALLKVAANKKQPTAMAWLGRYYIKGEHGLPQDLSKAKELLTQAAAMGHPVAVKELAKLNGESTSSCFITSAVCSSLERGDSCQELMAFRSFRDHWLITEPDGQTLISQYYKIAPLIVSKIDQDKDSRNIYQTIWDRYLKACYAFICQKQYLECKNLYIQMVQDLKQKYIKQE